MMERIKLIGYGLGFACLLACMGCGLFRNTTNHRETAHTETRKSSRQVVDSVTTRRESHVDLAVSEALLVSEAAIGFIAEGNVVIHPDGTVAADRVLGEVNRTDVQTSTNVTESLGQWQSVESVSGIKEIVESRTHDTAAIEKHARPNRTVFVIMLAIGVVLAAMWWYRSLPRR